jgi:predicted nuclease of restriction endonuclease-like (RecB) superfamily
MKSKGVVVTENIYADWLIEIKNRVRSTQLRTVLAANSEMILLYWSIGNDILERQSKYGWGSNVIGKLAKDLRLEFPEIKGFSPRNLSYMKAFAEAWQDRQFLQRAVAKLPWGHNIKILENISGHEERTWYVDAAVKNGWTRDLLVIQIENRLIDRQGSAANNFSATMPVAKAGIAIDMLKDPYVFDFLTLTENARERDLENALVEHLSKFMMELGKGFAYMGRQYHLKVGEKDRYLDLLFYNAKLHCYFNIDLKIGEFEPEFAGKMYYYLQAIDAQLKDERDDPSIGLILCKSKDRLEVELSLPISGNPMAVAEYKLLPPAIASVMPSPEQLDALKDTLSNDLERLAALSAPEEKS